MGPKTMRIGRALIGLVLAAMLATTAPPASAWQYTVDGENTIEMLIPSDWAMSVVVDSAGDIIAAGSIGVNPYVSDGLVVKLSGRLGAPSVLWQTRLTSDSSSPYNKITRVALDGAGNVLIAGFTGGLNEAYEIIARFAVAKLDGATGVILWEQEMVFPSFPLYGVPEEVTAVTVDSAGDVIAAGRVDPESDLTPNFAVTKLDGVTGAAVWQATGPNDSNFTSVAIDHANNVLVAGYQGGGAIVKYDGATGAELWAAVDPSGGFKAVAVDASDNVIAGGSGNFRVKKLDTNGTTIWDFNQGGGNSVANAVILDGAGDVFATGIVGDYKLASDMATFKIDGATGAALWESTIDGGASMNDAATAIALDFSGNPVVAGWLRTTIRQSMGVVKFAAATGVEIWRAVIDGAGTDDLTFQGQLAYGVAADPRGDVVAAGAINPVNGNYIDFAVVKLNGADGSDFVELCGNGVIEGGEICDDGNTAVGDGCSDTCQVEAGFLCLGQPSSCVVPVGVAPKKLVVVDKLAASGSAKTVFAAKDPNVAKGTGTDPTAISANFTAVYANGAARGGFAVPAGAWLINSAKVAKYVNKTAPAGPTQTKVALIRPGSTLSLTAKGIGDTPFDIVAAGDPAGDVNTAYCVANGGPTICHCSVNQNCVFTKVAGDTGAKLKCKGGLADPTCAALVP